jgi:PAS domain S-box-containing protein
VRFDITEQVAQEERIRQALEQSIAQEEELRQNAEEMAATQDQMRRLNREMEATLRAINRTSAMFELNPTGVIVRANDNFLRSVGYVGDELIGQPYTRLVKPEEAQSIEFRRFWNRLLEGIPEKGEFALLRSDGTEAWFIATFNPLTDENERVTRILAFASDITLEKEQEAMLRQTLQQLKSQSSGHSPELVAELERTRREFEAARRELTQQLDAAKRLTAFLELNAKGFITSVNDRLLEIMGYESYEIIGLHVDDLLDGPDSTHLKELLGNGHKPVEEARLKLKSKTGTLTQWSGWYQFSETDAGELSRVRLFLSLYE